jgi:hypothetical protein
MMKFVGGAIYPIRKVGRRVAMQTYQHLEKTMHHIETTMFDKPSGSVRGMVSVSINWRGKGKQIAHATILVDKEPSISIKVPASPTLDEISHITAALSEFSAKVKSAQA